MWAPDASLLEKLEPHEMPSHAELNLTSVEQQHSPDSEWRQRGTDCICITCKDPHSVYVAPNLIYTGRTDEKGMPIVAKRY